jgi:demethylmenaquinone methyltransferase/2-methoxy-6-polyprenyl-1,4-benzoquinol methylase
MDHFDLLAPWYDRLVHPPTDGRLALLLELEGSERVLDAAGGTGRIAQTLTSSAGQVVVADGSLRMLSGTRGKPGLLAVGALAERLPFCNGTFERVIMVDALHHVAEQPSVLVELWRLVAPGGRLVVEEPDLRRLAVKVIALAEKLALMRSHFVSAEWIAERLSQPANSVRVVRHGHTAWVIAQRHAAASSPAA